MTSLRSLETPTGDALNAIFPSMRNLADTSREWQQTERELAQVQARAGDIILGQDSINRIRWELDQNWYHLNDMQARQNARR
jgi:acyl dehydratase